MSGHKGATVVIGAAILAALAGCNQGPAERTGEKIDEAARELGLSLEATTDTFGGCVGEDNRNC